MRKLEGSERIGYGQYKEKERKIKRKILGLGGIRKIEKKNDYLKDIGCRQEINRRKEILKDIDSGWNKENSKR